MEAYQLYLKGRYYWNKLTEQDLKKSIEYFNQAVEKDPRYALAYAGLANAYITLGANDLPPKQMYPKAASYAQKALELDETLPDAHYVVAVSKLVYEWNISGAEKELSRTIELSPSHAAAHNLLGRIRISQGRNEEAVAEFGRALELDPYSLLFNVNLSYAYYFSRQYDKALEQMQKTLKQEPEASFIYSDMCVSYAQMGRHDDALAACQKAIILVGDEPWALSNLGFAYAVAGKRNEAEWVADKLTDMASKKYVKPYHVALIYAALGEKDKSFAWLDKALENRSSDLILKAKTDPGLDKIRSDPRYRILLQRMQSPPQAAG